MSAREEFKCLGYRITNDDELELRYSKKCFISDTDYVIFHKDDMTIDYFRISDNPFTPPIVLLMDMSLLKAINIQVEELRWNNE